jgi:hypothetical protein
VSFSSETNVKACRKPHRCIACNWTIAVGEPAVNWAGVNDDGFSSVYYHPECRAAEIAINHLHGTFGDEWFGLNEIDDEDRPWLREEHPIVAARMGIAP